MVGVTEPQARTTEELAAVPASVAVVGVGGGGCSAVQRIMKERFVPGVSYVCVNTDVRFLHTSGGAKLVQIGHVMTGAQGAGGMPEVGHAAAEADVEAIRAAIGSPDLVFVTAGLGGGTGTGAAPVVARVARETGALVVGVVTTPFSWEGRGRQESALAGARQLEDVVDNLIVIHNDRLLKLLHRDVSMTEALQKADEAVMYGILAVSELVNVPGDINVDMADVRTVMSQRGRAMMAIGEASGRRAVVECAQTAIANPLLDVSIDGAKGVLFCVNGGPSMTLHEVNEAGEMIAARIDRRAVVFFGMLNNEAMRDRVRLTLIATGIPDPISQKR